MKLKYIKTELIAKIYMSIDLISKLSKYTGEKKITIILRIPFRNLQNLYSKQCLGNRYLNSISAIRKLSLNLINMTKEYFSKYL